VADIKEAYCHSNEGTGEHRENLDRDSSAYDRDLNQRPQGSEARQANHQTMMLDTGNTQFCG
jgi:hypothetical protein